MKWQYKVVKFTGGLLFTAPPSAEKLEAELNKLGNDGWELVTFNNVGNMATFKKPVDGS